MLQKVRCTFKQAENMTSPFDVIQLQEIFAVLRKSAHRYVVQAVARIGWSAIKEALQNEHYFFAPLLQLF